MLAQTLNSSKTILCVGIGSIGGPMAGSIMKHVGNFLGSPRVQCIRHISPLNECCISCSAQFPRCSVYSRTEETMQKHREKYDSTTVDVLDVRFDTFYF